MSLSPALASICVIVPSHLMDRKSAADMGRRFKPPVSGTLSTATLKIDTTNIGVEVDQHNLEPLRVHGADLLIAITCPSDDDDHRPLSVQTRSVTRRISLLIPPAFIGGTVISVERGDLSDFARL